MSLSQRLLTLANPDRSRWQPMLGGLAIALTCVQAVTFLKPAEPLYSILVTLALVAWIVGAFAAAGYVRYYFGKELNKDRIRKDN
ncbi:MAG: hypothetical protein O3A06_03690 [Proteobacteria bacterium]|nr:hypothetical protein [Pseudomonadota bacterium]MDA0982138.1 hypothetical protein [Pseudomonadota bacterium]